MNMFILHWFKDKEVNFMFSMNISMFWLGGTVVNLISVRLFDHIISFYHETDKMSLSITLCVVTAATALLIIISAGTTVYLYQPGEIKDNSSTKNKDVTVKSLLNFSPLFWLYVFNSFLNYATVGSFWVLSQDFFMRNYNQNVEDASYMSTLYAFLAFLMAPVVGYLCDYLGRNLLFFTMGVVLALLSSMLFAFTSLNPCVGLVLMSMSAAFSSIRWGIIQYIVKDHQITMAYGIGQTGHQFSHAFGCITAGYLCDRFGYTSLPLVNFAFSLVGLGLLVIIYMLDVRMGRPLTISASQRNKIRANIKTGSESKNKE